MAGDSARAYRVRFRDKAWRSWSVDTGPRLPLASRCGRVLALDGRYERAGEAGDPSRPPRCGRPEGHPGPHRSAAAVARYLRADLDRQAARRG